MSAATEPVRTPQAGGWLSPAEARALLANMFGVTVATRTIQSWCRDQRRPLRHVLIGRRLLIHRDDLLDRVGPGAPMPTESSVSNSPSAR